MEKKYQKYIDVFCPLFLGCEFFKDYKDRDYTAEGLVFNWNQVSDDPESVQPGIILVWFCRANLYIH